MARGGVLDSPPHLTPNLLFSHHVSMILETQATSFIPFSSPTLDLSGSASITSKVYLNSGHVIFVAIILLELPFSPPDLSGLAASLPVALQYKQLG